jgi:hypothetical protein
MAQRRIFQASREEVSDLPVRGLSPANVAGGQYRVAVQQAPESGYTKLARSLSNVSAGLQAYAQAGQTVSEMYEQELQGMTLDQIKAEQVKMQKRLDGAERKGVLSFFGNPLNWERNEKALGRRYAQLLHDDTVSSKGRFYSPKAGDDKLLVSKILEEERSRWLTNNTELTQNPIMLQAFEGEWQQRSRMLEQRFNDQKRKQFLQNTASSVANAMIAEFEVLDDILESTENFIDNSDVKLAFQVATEKWGDVNALNAEDQKKILAMVAKSLAEDNPKMAYEFIDYAQTNLNVGGASYAEQRRHVRAMNTMVEEIESRAEDDAERDTQRKLTEENRLRDNSAAEMVSTHNASMRRLRDGQSVTFNDKEYTPAEIVQFKSDYRSMVVSLPDNRLSDKVASEIDKFFDLDADDMERENIFTRAKVPQVQAEYKSRLEQFIASKSKIDAVEYRTDPEVDTLRKNFEDELNQASQEAFDIVAIQGGSLFEKKDQFQKIYNQRALEILQEYKQEFAPLGDSIKKGEQQFQKEVSKPTELKPVNLRPWYENKKGAEMAKGMEKNLDVMLFSEDEKDIQKAKEYFWDVFDTRGVKDIIDGKNIYKTEPVRTYVFGEGVVEVEGSGVLYTDEDKQAYEKVYLKLRAITGAYYDLDKFPEKTDEKGVYRTDDGYFIDASKLDSGKHMILTPDEIEAADVKMPSVVEKAKRLGVTPVLLLRNQTKLYEDYKPVLRRLER